MVQALDDERDQIPSRAAQVAWMQSLRPRTAHVEFVFNDGDDGHPLVGLLAHLDAVRTVGVEAGNGYSRSRRTAVRRRYAYDRDIIRAIDDLGGFFPDDTNPDRWTGLGDVDVVFLDGRGHVLGATVTHEGMLIDTDRDPGFS